ncbi:hypothetical protein ABIE40_004759 [Rhizobium sp. OAE497]
MRPELREIVMKTKTLAVLMTALSIGVSPVGIMSASAQDAPIIKKKGAAQTDQSGGATQQQPDASDGAGGKAQVQPGTSTEGGTAPAQSGSETKPDASGNGAAQGGGMKPSGTSGTDGSKPSTETQKSGSQESGTSSETQKSGSDAQKSGDATKPSGSTETQTNSKTNVENNTTVNKTTNVNISVEQQTEIRQVVKEVHVEPVREVNFTVSVGTAIPKKIRLEPLPPRIVKIVPQYETYRFFILADGRIVIVDPTAYTIVYIITA